MSNPIVHTRRDFLNRSLALVSASATVPLFLDRTASVMDDAPKGGKVAKRRDDRPILVVIQLAGGNDGLNTVIPMRNDRYYQARPRIAVRKDAALKLTDEIGLHPAAAGLKRLFDDGRLAIVQGVGYPNPNRSHFVATDIWATADPDQRLHDGWLGRYFDCTCKGADPDPRQGIAITQEAPLAMIGDRFSPVSFGSPSELTWRSPAGSKSRQEAFKRLNQTAEGHPNEHDGPMDSTSALAYLERVAMDARASAAEIQDAAGGSARPGGRIERIRERIGGGRGRGGQLGQQLGMVRRMIAAGLATRVYYVSLGGFDTHAQQVARQQQLLEQLGDAMATFVDELKADGTLDRVLVVTFSEFGRRVTENASQGTDHGAAAPMFIAGGRVKPGILTAHPSLEPDNLDRGDLKWSTDFRGVYAGILRDWMKVDAETILGGRFDVIQSVG